MSKLLISNHGPTFDGKYCRLPSCGESWPCGDAKAAMREGVKALNEGRIRPWEDVQRELFGGDDDNGVVDNRLGAVAPRHYVTKAGCIRPRPPFGPRKIDQTRPNLIHGLPPGAQGASFDASLSKAVI